VCQARLFEPLSLFFFFLSGGPGLAGWILYRSASLVVDACCNKDIKTFVWSDFFEKI